MVMYASGVLRRMREADEMIGLARPPFKQVRMIIAQPRLGHFPEWALPMATADGALGFDFWESSILRGAGCGDENAPLLPGEKGCRWCPAKAACPALAAQVEEATGALFDDLTAPEKPDDLTGAADLSRKMQLVGLVEGLVQAVRAETERRLLAGEPVDGFKLVKGRQGPRKWADAAEAEAALKGMKLGVHEMYDLSLISPTTAEKQTAEYVGGDGETRKPAIGPRQWKKLELLITRAPKASCPVKYDRGLPDMRAGGIQGAFTGRAQISLVIGPDGRPGGRDAQARQGYRPQDTCSGVIQDPLHGVLGLDQDLLPGRFAGTGRGHFSGGQSPARRNR